MAKSKKDEAGTLNKVKSPALILTASQILDSEDLGRELLEIPEWDGHVYVHILTGAERDKWENDLIKTRTKGGRFDIQGLKARLVIATTRNEAGDKIFTPDQAAALQSKNAKALDRISQVAQRLSGMSDEDVEEIAKN